MGGTDGLREQDASKQRDRLHFGWSYKRLEQGTFTFPRQVTETATSVAVDVHELSMLLEGIDVTKARTSARWEPPPHAPVG